MFSEKLREIENVNIDDFSEDSNVKIILDEVDLW